MATTLQVVLDAAQPSVLAQFWASALGYVEQPPPEGFDSWEQFASSAGIPQSQWGDMAAVVDPAGVRPRLLIQRVPEPKTAKNRVHLDLIVSGGREVALDERRARVEAEVSRLLEQGASRLWTGEEPNGYWVTLADPEGNEFCVS